MGRLRLLRLALAVVLGAAPAPHRSTVGAADRLPARGAGDDERDICLETIERAQIARAGQTPTADKGYRSARFEDELNAAGIALIRPATKTEPARPARRFLKPLRQIIESINCTLKAQLGP